MNLYTEKINERLSTEAELTMDEFKKYVDEISKKLKQHYKPILLIMGVLYDHQILEKEIVDMIKEGNTSSMKAISKEYKVPMEDLVSLQKLMHNLGSDIRLLPMYQSKEEREAFIKGDMDIEDITLDLETDRGRDNAAKKYAYIVTAVAKKYMGKSGLDWNGLISAGMEGLTLAMNDYHKGDDRIDAETNNNEKAETKKQKRMSFKTYAWFRVRQRMLYDMNNLSRTVKINQHEYEKNKASGNTRGNFNTIRPDLAGSDEEGVSGWDRMAEIADMADVDNREDQKQWDDKWKQIYKLIEDKFSTRAATIFYQVFGINGEDKRKGKEIAAEFGVTSTYITTITKKIAAWLKSNPSSRELLDELLGIYSESFIGEYYNKSEEVLEAMIQDDVYIFLNEITRFNNKQVLNNAIGEAFEEFNSGDRDMLMSCLEGDFDNLDDKFSDNRKVMVKFLEHLYPTESLKKKSDTVILYMMEEVIDTFKTNNEI